jgi:hypothetical protein
MVDEEHVAARDGDLAGHERAVLLGYECRDAERERQRVRSRPLDREDRRVVERVDGRDHACESDGMAVAAVGVRLLAGGGADDLLEQQDVARREVGLSVVVQGGPRAARGEAALPIAPGVERDGVAGAPERQVV